MIIAISAPPIVDAASYAEQRARELRLPVLSDPLRQRCLELKFQTVYDMPLETQMWVRREVLKAHCNWVQAGEDAVLDFSVATWCADWMRWCWSCTPAAEWEQVREWVNECLRRYDEIVHIEAGPLKAYDGYVWRDPNNAAQINRLIQFIYEDAGVLARVKFVAKNP
jgi:hypothetical protein